MSEERDLLKIIDFGTSRKVLRKDEKMQSRMGTPYYIAPEVLKHDYTIKCDIWSCGVILYILLCGYPPFNGSTDRKILMRIKKGKFDFPKEEWEVISKEAKQLIKMMLNPDPTKRPNAVDILKHSWFEKSKIKKINLNNKNLLLKKMKNFTTRCKFQNAICLYFVNFFDLKEEKE